MGRRVHVMLKVALSKVLNIGEECLPFLYTADYGGPAAVYHSLRNGKVLFARHSNRFWNFIVSH